MHTQKCPQQHQNGILLHIVAWECGECATINKGRADGLCINCHTENPCWCEILAGSAPAATAWMTCICCTLQHDIVQLANQATSVAAVPHPLTNCVLLQCFQGMLVDIVGTEVGDRWTCHAHKICSEQLVPRSKVHFQKGTIISLVNRGEKNIFLTYIAGIIMLMCKVGYLPWHFVMLTITGACKCSWSRCISPQ
jgi:hypothetical protein